MTGRFSPPSLGPIPEPSPESYRIAPHPPLDRVPSRSRSQSSQPPAQRPSRDPELRGRLPPLLPLTSSVIGPIRSSSMRVEGASKPAMNPTAAPPIARANRDFAIRKTLQAARFARTSAPSGVASPTAEVAPPTAETIGGAAVGFIAGLLAPSTQSRRRTKRADDRRGQRRRRRKPAAKFWIAGKDVVQEAGSEAVRDTEKERGREEGEELSESLQEKARELDPEKAAKTSLSSLSSSARPSRSPPRAELGSGMPKQRTEGVINQQKEYHE